MNRTEILARTRVVQSKHQVSSDLAGEIVLLNVQTGVYYSLDEVGARIWSLMCEPRTIDEICETILEEYDVDRDRCERDLRMLLEKLGSAGLIEISHEAVA